MIEQEFKDLVIETLYSHYKNNGGYTRVAAGFIEKLTGEKWERDQQLTDMEREIEHLREININLKKSQGIPVLQYLNNIVKEQEEDIDGSVIRGDARINSFEIIAACIFIAGHIQSQLKLQYEY